jgi:integrase
MFAAEWEDVTTPSDKLGQPLRACKVERQFQQLTKEAGVSSITVHGLRHTCATSLLVAGIPAHVVAQRLGHADARITLSTYAHCLPDQQQAAADVIGRVLHGRCYSSQLVRN